MSETTEDLARLRDWRTAVVRFLQDETLSPAEWLQRRDHLVRGAPKG